MNHHAYTQGAPPIPVFLGTWRANPVPRIGRRLEDPSLDGAGHAIEQLRPAATCWHFGSGLSTGASDHNRQAVEAPTSLRTRDSGLHPFTSLQDEQQEEHSQHDAL